MTRALHRATAELVGSFAPVAGRLPRLSLLCVLLTAMPAFAEKMVFTLDTKESEVRIILGATLHTVDGRAALEPATFRWDTDSGSASGRVVVQANRLRTGIDARDQKMREDVLVSALHPEIVFEATGFELRQSSAEKLRFVLKGDLSLLGVRHEIELETHAHPRPDNSWKARADLSLPYVEWGLTDPSLPLFSVDKYVTVEVKAVGSLEREAQ